MPLGLVKCSSDAGSNLKEVNNRPLPSFQNPHFQNEAKCTTFAPGKQHTNLWASSGFLGVPSLFRRYNPDLCLSGWFLASMPRDVIITLFLIIHPHCTILIALTCTNLLVKCSSDAGSNLKEVNNRPLPSFQNPHFQNEAKCTTFAPGKQHTNLWASSGFLGVPSLFRRYNPDLCLSGWFLASMPRDVIITLFLIIHPHCTILIALTLVHYFAYKQIQSIFVWL